MADLPFGAPLRERYPDASPCACTIDGLPCSPSSFSVRSMNFGQHWRTAGVVEVRYQVELPRRFLADVLASELPEIVRDAQQFPSDDTELEAALRARGWPPAEVVAAEDALAIVATRYLGHDLLSHWLGGGPPEERPGCVINSIEEVTLSAEKVCFAGKGRKGDIAVRYQDV